MTRSNEAHKITTVQEGDLYMPGVDNESRCNWVCTAGTCVFQGPSSSFSEPDLVASFRAGMLGALLIHPFVSKHCWYII